MTVSTHEYTATLVVDADEYPIRLRREGEIVLDEGAAPHVQSSLELALPDEATLGELDPRGIARVRVDVHAEFPSGAQGRSFDLGLRRRTIRHTRDGFASVSAASDEALLSDYRPLADVEMFGYQASLVSLVNEVLDTAIPGASLEAGAPDPDVKVYGTTTNLFIDPASEAVGGGGYTPVNCQLDANDASWAAVGTDSFNLYSSTNTDSYLGASNVPAGGIPYGMRTGATYVVSATANVKVAFTGADGPSARRIVVLHRLANTSYTVVSSAAVPNVVGSATRVSVRFQVPPNATEVVIRFYHGGAAGGPGQIRWDAFRLSEYTGDPTDVGYFDGNTPDTAGYQYDWGGTALASPSNRKALIEREPELLLWKAGVDALTFLHPIVQAFGLRLVCDEQRRWTLREETYTAPGTLAIFHGVNLIEGEDAIDRDSGLWFDAQVTVYKWTDAAGVQQERVDAFALNDPAISTNRVEVNAPYPGPGRSEYAVRRAQGRGREVTATTVADWTTHAEQAVQIGLDASPLQVGETSRVRFDLSTDRMTITTRTTELAEGAIDLLLGTIDALAGAIDAL